MRGQVTGGLQGPSDVTAKKLVTLARGVSGEWGVFEAQLPGFEEGVSVWGREAQGV